MSRKSSGRGWILQSGYTGGYSDNNKNIVNPQHELFDLNGPTPCVAAAGRGHAKLMKTLLELYETPTSQLWQPKEENSSQQLSPHGGLLEGHTGGYSDNNKNIVKPQHELSDLNGPFVAVAGRGRGKLMKTLCGLSETPSSQLGQPKEENSSQQLSPHGGLLEGHTGGYSDKNIVKPQHELSDLNGPFVAVAGRGRGKLMKTLCGLSETPSSQLGQPKEENCNQPQLSPPARGRGKLWERIFSNSPIPCLASGGELMNTLTNISTTPTSPLEQPKEVVISKTNEDIKKSGITDELANMVSNLALSISNKSRHTREEPVLPVLNDHKPLNHIRKNLACINTSGAIINYTNVVDLQKWIVIHSENDSIIREVIKMLEKHSRLIGVNISLPTILYIPSYQVDDYKKAFNDNIDQEVQLVVCILDSRNRKVFNEIKLISYEMEVPIQFLLTSSLSQLYQKIPRQHILMQIKNKLGGSIWSVKIPPMSAMFVGIHSYDCKVITITASINANYTHCYCRGILQNQENEIVSELCSSMLFALIEYQNYNYCLPEKIVIFRTGVEDGQQNFDAAYEISQFQRVFDNYTPNITFIVIQRNLLSTANIFTQEYRYDFSLNWKSSEKKPVNVNRFVVVHDDSDLGPNFLKILIKKLSTPCINLWFKEPLPACSQDAENTAKFVANNLQCFK